MLYPHVLELNLSFGLSSLVFDVAVVDRLFAMAT